MSMDDWDGTTEQKAAEAAWLRIRQAFADDELKHVTRDDGTRLSYVDARTIQARLDSAVGPQRWKATVTPTSYGLVVRLSIRPERDGSWFDREDVADWGDPQYGMMESAFTKAFRRAAAQFGIARQCYLDNSMEAKRRREDAAPARASPPRRQAPPPARGLGEGLRVIGQSPWNEDRVFDVQGQIPSRDFSFNERWANFSHGQPGSQRFGWDEYNGFTRSQNGSFTLKDMTWSLMADRAVLGDDLCGYLVWELETIGFDARYHTQRCAGDEERLRRAKRRHEYRVSQIKGVLLYIRDKARRGEAHEGDADELPLEYEDQIASTYDSAPF